MYETITYEEILKRMLEKIPDNMDKREGSIIYDALAPAAVELQLMYIELDVILKETFADTASRDYLVRRTAERGITPSEAACAVVKGVFEPAALLITAGTRFSCNHLNYCVTEKITDGEYRLQCETRGGIGNGNFGSLVPIQYVQGLEKAELTELLIPGEDEEETESIRKRYFNSFHAQEFGGNCKDYQEKTNAIAGVGDVKVIPVWKGGGTVKLTILDSEYNKANEALIQKVQQIIDPTTDGAGAGLAPIGHIVTVDTPEETAVTLTMSVSYDTGYSYEGLESQMTAAVEGYLLELRKGWVNQEKIIVRTAQIESRMLAIEGILDIVDTVINGVAGNLTMAENHIPVKGGLTA